MMVDISGQLTCKDSPAYSTDHLSVSYPDWCVAGTPTYGHGELYKTWLCCINYLCFHATFCMGAGVYWNLFNVVLLSYFKLFEISLVCVISLWREAMSVTAIDLHYKYGVQTLLPVLLKRASEDRRRLLLITLWTFLQDLHHIWNLSEVMPTECERILLDMMVSMCVRILVTVADD